MPIYFASWAFKCVCPVLGLGSKVLSRAGAATPAEGVEAEWSGSLPSPKGTGLRHPDAWHDPPAKPPPHGVPSPYTYKPSDDAGPTPDYENVLPD